MKYSWANDALSCGTQDYLNKNGAYYAGMASCLEIKGLDLKKNSIFYFICEFVRLRDFLGLLFKLGPDDLDGINQRKKDITAPILRSIYEGAIKVNYVFGAKDGDKDDDITKLEERFQEIVKMFVLEYDQYSVALDEIYPETNPFPLLGGGNKISIKKLINKYISAFAASTADADTNTDIMYQYYKYLCFFSHGNSNPALLREAKIDVYPKIDTLDVADRIAYSYLKLLSELIECTEFDGLLEKVSTEAATNHKPK